MAAAAGIISVEAIYRLANTLSSLLATPMAIEGTRQTNAPDSVAVSQLAPQTSLLEVTRSHLGVREAGSSTLGLAQKSLFSLKAIAGIVREVQANTLTEKNQH